MFKMWINLRKSTHLAKKMSELYDRVPKSKFRGKSVQGTKGSFLDWWSLWIKKGTVPLWSKCPVLQCMSKKVKLIFNCLKQCELLKFLLGPFNQSINQSILRQWFDLFQGKIIRNILIIYSTLLGLLFLVKLEIINSNAQITLMITKN